MKLSKITHKLAASLGFTLEAGTRDLDDGIECTVVEIWEKDEDCESLCSYICNDDGSFSFLGAVALPHEIKEDLPAYLNTEQMLRNVLKFIAESMPNQA